MKIVIIFFYFSINFCLNLRPNTQAQANNTDDLYTIANDLLSETVNSSQKVKNAKFLTKPQHLSDLDQILSMRD